MQAHLFPSTNPIINTYHHQFFGDGLYVTFKKLQTFGLAKTDIPIGFCRKSTFLKNFDDVMKIKADSALTAIDLELQALTARGVLPPDSRISVVSFPGDSQKSQSYAYIEKENGKDYLVLQVDVTLGTPNNPKGIISACTYWGESSEKIAVGTLDDIEAVKGKIVEKLIAYRSEHADTPRPAGWQTVSMAFADGFF